MPRPKKAVLTAKSHAQLSIQELAKWTSLAPIHGWTVIETHSLSGDLVPPSCTQPRMRLCATIVCSHGHCKTGRIRNLRLQRPCVACQGKTHPPEKLKSDIQAMAEKAGFELSVMPDSPRMKDVLTLNCGKKNDDGKAHGSFDVTVRKLLDHEASPACPQCRPRKKPQKPYAQLKEEMAQLGWTLLLKEEDYVGSTGSVGMARAKARCQNGHEEEKAIKQFSDRKQCTQCLDLMVSKGESVARELLEQILELPLPAASPPFLAGKRFDGYNADLKLAFEYDGPYHFSEFSKKLGSERVKNTKERDQEKNRLCQIHGIALIRIRFVQNQNDKNQWIDALTKAFKNSGLKLPHELSEGLDLDAAHRAFSLQSQTQRLREIERNFDVTCLEPAWRGVWHLYPWQCHYCQKVFHTSTISFREGRCKGCKECKVDQGRTGHIKTLTEEGRAGLLGDLKATVEKAGFFLKDTEWQGSEEHLYTLNCQSCQSPMAIKACLVYEWTRNDWFERGESGCRPCRLQGQLNTLLAPLGIHCLTPYSSNAEKVTLECQQGHQWQEQALRVKKKISARETPCPICQPRLAKGRFPPAYTILKS